MTDNNSDKSEKQTFSFKQKVTNSTNVVVGQGHTVSQEATFYGNVTSEKISGLLEKMQENFQYLPGNLQDSISDDFNDLKNQASKKDWGGVKRVVATIIAAISLSADLYTDHLAYQDFSKNAHEISSVVQQEK